MPAASPQKRTRMSAADRRIALLEGARELVQQIGTERLTMDGLAAHCGVNKALPYTHFKNKDDVLLALYELTNAELDELVAVATEGLETFEDRIEAVVNTWVSYMNSGRDVPTLQQARTADGTLEKIREERVNGIIEFIATEIRSGRKIGPRRAKIAAAILVAGTQGLVYIYDNPDLDKKQLVDAYIKMAFASIDAMTD